MEVIPIQSFIQGPISAPETREEIQRSPLGLLAVRTDKDRGSPFAVVLFRLELSKELHLTTKEARRLKAFVVALASEDTGERRQYAACVC